MIDRNDRLAHKEDVDISQGLQELFQDEGIEVLMKANVTRVEGKSGRSVRLRVTQGSSEIMVDGSHLLVAAGRTPNTADIGLELAGVELTDHGYIKVNERLETTAPGVWAVGDCAGSPQFTHISFDDFRGHGRHHRRSSRNDRTPGSVLHVHRSGTGPSGAKRSGSQSEGNCLSIGENSDGDSSAHAHSFRNPGLHEGANRHRERSHSRLYLLRSGCWGNHGFRTNRNDRGTTVHRLARRRPDSSHSHRGTDSAIRISPNDRSVDKSIELWIQNSAVGER